MPHLYQCLTDNVIKRVETLAHRQWANPGLVFGDREQQPINDLDDYYYDEANDADYNVDDDEQDESEFDEDYEYASEDDDEEYNEDIEDENGWQAVVDVIVPEPAIPEADEPNTGDPDPVPNDQHMNEEPEENHDAPMENPHLQEVTVESTGELISTSQDARSFDPEPHCTSGLPQYHHPPRLMPIYNALSSGSTIYSMTPPSTLMCFASQKQFKMIHRSLLHLTDLSLLLSEPMAGSAPYLMARYLPPTMDPFSAVCHHPSTLKHMDSSLTSDSYTMLANTLTPPYPRKLSSTLTPPVCSKRSAKSRNGCIFSQTPQWNRTGMFFNK